jgi:hypothetical protein
MYVNTEENKRWKGPEYEKVIRYRGLKQQLCGSKQTKNPTKKGIGGWSSGHLSPLGRGGPTYKILKLTLELEFAKQANGISSGLQRSKHWTLWRGRPPPKHKKNVRVRRARCGGGPATPGVIVPIGESEKENKRERN